MTANTSYTFQLRATSAGGNGAYSIASAPKLTLPATPGTVTATRGAAGSKAATLAWAAPSGTGTITGYAFQVSVNGAAFAAVPVGVTVVINGATASNAAGTGAAIGGLTVPNTTYSFKLAVTNSSGTSAYSNNGSTTFTAR
jgi:hypothetical protein